MTKIQAYPNIGGDEIAKPTYNLSKWIDATKNLYAKAHFGTPFPNAFSEITKDWSISEKTDFSNWLSYYQQGNQHKYTKTAQLYMSQNIPSYFLSPKNDTLGPGFMPSIPESHEISKLDDAPKISKEEQDKIDKEEKRALIEEQRKKIIGRIHAAIKHLTAYEGHLLVGPEFERLLSSMYEILKQFQMVNKVSLSGTMFQDVILRQANKLKKEGFIKGGEFLSKFCQKVPGAFDFAQSSQGLPIASTEGSGVTGGLGSNAPSAASIAQGKPDILKSDKDKSTSILENTTDESAEKEPLDELFDNLETAGLTDVDDSKIDDLDINLADLTVEAQMEEPHVLSNQSLNSIYQQERPASIKQPKPKLNDLKTNLEVEAPDERAIESNNIDKLIDNALSNVTVQDAIDRLENVIAIYKNRRLSRELSMVDMILSKLQLSSLFPELGESLQKLFESNGYILNRLERVSSQLRGTLESDINNIDLMKDNESDKELNNIRQQLEEKQNKEKTQKEMRKRFENEDLQDKIHDNKSILPIKQNNIQELTNQPKPQLI